MAKRTDELFQLTDKVALITGGSRGLGREMALAFARAGADVVVTSRKIENCRAVASQVEAVGRRAVAYACHVGRWTDIDGLVTAAYEHFGRIDILVNNAGMSPLYPSLVEITEELWDKVVSVNLKGPFRLSALIGNRMAAGNGGSIINISAVASIRPTPSVAPYAAAKAGLNAITVALAHGYGPKVRVNAIMAGYFMTDISKAWDLDAVTKHLEVEAALKRAGQPQEIIGAALYFASAASSYTTGSVLRIDGGLP